MLPLFTIHLPQAVIWLHLAAGDMGDRGRWDAKGLGGVVGVGRSVQPGAQSGWGLRDGRGHTHGNKLCGSCWIFPVCELLETNVHTEQQARTQDKFSICFVLAPAPGDGVAVSAAGSVYVKRETKTQQPLAGTACLMLHEAPWK